MIQYESMTKYCIQYTYNIRQLRKIHNSLTISISVILANSLVLTRLDYCNSLLHNLIVGLSVFRLVLFTPYCTRTLLFLLGSLICMLLYTVAYI